MLLAVRHKILSFNLQINIKKLLLTLEPNNCNTSLVTIEIISNFLFRNYLKCINFNIQSFRSLFEIISIFFLIQVSTSSQLFVLIYFDSALWLFYLNFLSTTDLTLPPLGRNFHLYTWLTRIFVYSLCIFIRKISRKFSSI